MSQHNAMGLLRASFSYSRVQSATEKCIEIICFANFAIFHVYLIQIYLTSNFAKNSDFLI